MSDARSDDIPEALAEIVQADTPPPARAAAPRRPLDAGRPRLPMPQLRPPGAGNLRDSPRAQ